MNDQERQVIDDIFQRLEQVANQPRDPEAERYIAEKLRRQPYAPYALAQAVFVQEQALGNLQAENERLRAEVDRVSRQPQQGGFLSSIFGGGASRPPEPAYNAPPPRQASPWGQPQPYPQPPYGGPQGGPMMGGAPGPWGGMQRGGGGGFLGSALTTAAGVAGGMMIANALSHAFSGDNNPLSNVASAAGLEGVDQAADAGIAGITDALYPNQDPQEDDQDFSDFGGDGGDEGDWT
ncbi:DUF2076 domain-containing protein [Microvirga calopogonii]|uniref:DUF2076 domain-containing protein n=1 Tax=Microvirga calopogonii TaxID=2078013 RepID=UPI000E0D2390|nr:DUF2076 domain-containing protein [Microvirga calopogonii]